MKATALSLAFAALASTSCWYDWTTPSATQDGGDDSSASGYQCGSNICNGTCAPGGCAFDCPTGDTCNGSCSGGGCPTTCHSGSVCNVDCALGGCSIDCQAGATCNVSCSGGGCALTCDGLCNHTCSGGGCTCTGPNC